LQHSQTPLRARLSEPRPIRGSPRPATCQNRRLKLSTIKGALHTVNRLCPLYPRKRTLSEAMGMSALCHKPTYAVQQRVPLFDETTSKSLRARHAGEPGAPTVRPTRYYASTNRRNRQATYPAVCSERATLLGNVDRANRKPQCGRN